MGYISQQGPASSIKSTCMHPNHLRKPHRWKKQPRATLRDRISSRELDEPSHLIISRKQNHRERAQHDNCRHVSCHDRSRTSLRARCCQRHNHRGKDGKFLEAIIFASKRFRLCYANCRQIRYKIEVYYILICFSFLKIVK